MSARRLPIGELAQGGMADMVRAARAAPGLFVFFLVLGAAAAFIEAAVPGALGLSSGMDLVVTIAAHALVTAAVAVALHRFVILSELNSVASLLARWRTVLDFASVLFGAQFLILLPTLLAGSIWARQEDMPVWIPPLCIALALTGFLALLRHLLVFPAIAIDAEDRSLRTGAAGAGRVILPIVCASIVAMLLISLAGALIGAPLLLLGFSQSSLVIKLFALVAEVAMSAATVAVVSRAYLWREGRQPADG
ncbi:hypothetical protein [Methylopila sp. M107]|uniref:hypothetical protein n=1 Tax=Methylopila sp. M107 TaxID=1101190 RepID=UPI000372BB9D|nr:hypothetical protein [Methylopila sp. M107]